jgi:hypothetical protein
MNMRIKTFLLCALFIIATLACTINNINISAPSDLELTITAQAVLIQQTSQALAQPQPQAQPQSQAQPQPQPQATAAPAATNTPEPTATTQKPTIINSNLCWLGPGEKYEVMSSVSKGQTVELLGRGSVAGWFIIRNPIYNDPCWIQDRDIQIDPSLDLNSLKIFNPPPLPTNTPKPTPVPSPTPV